MCLLSVVPGSFNRHVPITCSECKVQVLRLQEDLMAGLDEEATRDGVQYVLQCSKRLQVT
jgi:hypothetical protein